MTNLDTLMNSSLAAVAETDFQPFTELNAGRQRKVLSVRNLSKAYQAQHKVLDGISFDLHAGEAPKSGYAFGNAEAGVPVRQEPIGKTRFILLMRSV